MIARVHGAVGTRDIHRRDCQKLASYQRYVDVSN